MKKIRRAAVAVLALAAAAIFVPKASAEEYFVRLSSGSTMSIPISRKITNVGGHVSVKYTYKLVPSPDNPGYVGGLQSTTNITFNRIVDAGAGETIGNCSLALQNMTFSKVGDYTFTLSEHASTNQSVYPLDTVNKYDIYFQVTNKLDENDEPTGELQVRLLDQMYSYKDDAKVPLRAQFESPANYTYIVLDSKVSGSAADAGKYFKYKVDFTGLVDGATLTIKGQDSSVSYGGETISTKTQYTVGDGDLYVYLKHGQEVTIGKYESQNITAYELPDGISYTITKVEADDGYTSKIDGAEVVTVAKSATISDANDFSIKNVTLAINSKDSTVNTGVLISAWPYMAIALFGLSGFIVFRRILKNA